MKKTIIKKALAIYSSSSTKQADIIMRLFSRVPRIKQFLWQNLEIGETSQHHFFNDPNPVSSYGINILFTKNGTPYENNMSAFSRFGHTLLDEKAKILVYTIPKVGSTTLKNFAKNELHLVDTLEERVHCIKFPGIIDRSIQIPEIIKWDDYRDYDQYIVMRQPYEKILSFFTNKFIRLVKQIPKPTLYHLNFMDHLSKAGQGSQKMISSDALELSFDIFIRRLKYHYDHGNKLWDEHLALQISSDFENIALDKVKVLPLSKLNDLLDDWYFKRYGERKDFSSKKENASYGDSAPIFIENAHLMPLKELIKIENAIDPKSFYQAELEDMIKEMYAVDYKIWNSIKE
jgi:hypothetical protein